MIRPLGSVPDFVIGDLAGPPSDVAATLEAPTQEAAAAKSPAEPSAEPAPPSKPAKSEPSVYGSTFWLCYLSNGALTAAAALLYRYADFVNLFGGGEFELGWIVGIGMTGSLAMRWWLGAGIDRIGPRRVWLASQALFITVVAAHVLITTIHGPAVYALRILYQIAIAGVFGSSITFISRTVPAWRMAEVLGTLGTSGFIGMAVGPVLGDLLAGGFESASLAEQTAAMRQMFLVSAGLGIVALIAAAWATRHSIRPARRRRPHTLWLLRKYHPGALLAVGFAMGILITLPSTFLRPYLAELGIREMKLFFLVYAPTAFFARLATRRMSAEWGVRPVILLGLGLAVISVFGYLAVDRYAMLALPAAFAGVSHALLFPTLMAGGAIAFPDRHRGLATTLMLASMDVGTLVGSPLVGGTVTLAGANGWPAYPAAFGVVIAVLAAAFIIYARRR
ncbi:MAG: MFS transporter [Pirellulales bacterium]